MKKKTIEFENVVSLFVRDDSNVVIKALLSWQLENKVYPLRLGGMSGGGRYAAFYTPQDAKKVKKFLSTPQPKKPVGESTNQ